MTISDTFTMANRSAQNLAPSGSLVVKGKETISTLPDVAPMALRPLDDAPLVSVVITSYNYEEFIGDALDSVLGQDYANVEVIVADDGSTDKTAEIAREQAAADSRVRLVTGENLGQPGNTSRGYAATSGEIICFLDADDQFMPGKIRAVVEAFRRSPDCGLCLHRVQKVNRSGRPFGRPWPGHIPSGWLLECLLSSGGRTAFPPTSAVSIRRQVGERVFPIRSKSRRAGDAYIHYPAAFLTKVVVLPRAYAKYREHQHNMGLTGNSRVARLAGHLRVCEEVFYTNQEFVSRELGDQYAAVMRLTDAQWFLESALPYLLVSGEAAYRGLSMEQLCALLAAGKPKRVWERLVRLPRPLAKQLFLARENLGALMRIARGALPPRLLSPANDALRNFATKRAG